MNTKKFFTVLIALAALTFVLSACDGVTLEDLQSSNRLNSDSLNVNLKSDDSSRDAEEEDDNSLSDDPSADSQSSSMSSGSMQDDSMNGSKSSELKVKGEVTAVTANSITIGGITYTFDTTEDLTTLFSMGDFIEVEYLINEDGSITLYEFEFEDSMDDDSMDDPYTEVKAFITEVTANTITINDQTFTVDTLEDLALLFTAGQIYEIEYILNADGTVTLLSFELEDDMDDDMDDDDDDMDDDSDDDMDDDNNDSDDDMNNDNNNDDNNDNSNDDNNNNDNNNDDSSDDNS